MTHADTLRVYPSPRAGRLNHLPLLPSPRSSPHLKPLLYTPLHLLLHITMAASHGDLRHLLPGNYKRQITDWLEEDCPSFDYGGFVVGESEGEARLLGKSEVSQIVQSFTDSDCRPADRQLSAHLRYSIPCTNTMHRASSPASPSSTKSFPNSAARTNPLTTQPPSPNNPN